MADSYIIYTASGAQDTFSIPFGYLDPAHMNVSVNNVAATFTFPSGSQVQVSPMPTNGQKVKVFRTTPRTTRQVVWQNASNLTATDLNASDLQLLYITQEAFDTVADAILKDDTGIYNADGIRISNVGTPTQTTDAATKAYVDANTVDIVDDAIAARDAAIAAKVDAEAALAATQAVYDNFDDRYLGQKASAPTLDNDGNALLDGAIYYNTATNQMFVYDLGTTTWLLIETNIPNGSVTTVKLANLAVDSTKLAANAVTAGKMADGGVDTTARIANAIVTYAKLATASISTTAAQLVAGTASLLVTCASFKAWLDTKYVLVNPVTITTGIALAQDFTKPAAITTVTKFAVNLVGFSTNGTSMPMIQLADAGGVETTGYVGATDNTSMSTGVLLGGTLATNVYHGTIYFTLIDAATNTYSYFGVLAIPASPTTFRIAGYKTLSQPLTGIRLTTVTGSDQADSGTLGILWEG